MNLAQFSSNTPLGRLIRLPLRLIPEDAVVPILRGPLRGRKWIAGSLTHGCWLGSYEHDKQGAFAALVGPGSTVFDVGANVGFYTLLAAKCAGPDGRVIAFEPLPRNLALIRKHLELNGLDCVHVVEAAVGEKSGRASFDSGPTHAMGSLRSDGDHEVAVVCLDELVDAGTLPAPDVIKMDIEGGELGALRGARALLERHGPSLFLATHGPDVHRSCCELLGELGYELTPIDGRRLDETDELLATRRR